MIEEQYCEMVEDRSNCTEHST